MRHTRAVSIPKLSYRPKFLHYYREAYNGEMGDPWGTRLNLRSNRTFTLSWRASREEAAHGAQADTTLVPFGVSAPLADSDAGGGRGRTTAAGCAHSIVAGPAPAGTARSTAAPTAHPHAATAPDAARHRGHHCELGVAAGAVHRRGAEGLGPRGHVGRSAAAGQCPGDHQTVGRVAGRRGGAALCGGLRTAACPRATCPAAPR